MSFRAYKIRLYPNSKQERQLLVDVDACRFVYNWALQISQSAYKRLGKGLSRYDISNQLTICKKLYLSFLQKASAKACQDGLARFDSSQKHFFRKIKLGEKTSMSFKSKKFSKKSVTYPCVAAIHHPKEKRIQLPKIGKVVYRSGYGEFEGKFKYVTVTQDKLGNWFASLLYDTGKEFPPKVGVNQKTTVGMDLGLTSLWTLSDGRKLDNPRFFKQLDDKLKELQRLFSKTTKGSARRNKLRLLIAKHYRNIKNKKEDFLHKATTKLLSENQVQTVVVENLEVKSLKEQKHASMNRAVSNASWAKIAYMLEYKSNWLGKNYISVNPSYTSQVCSSCKHHEGKHELDMREWTCTACGAVHDRDINAAINIRNLGLGYSLCVSPSDKRERDRTCKPPIKHLHEHTRDHSKNIDE